MFPDIFSAYIRALSSFVGKFTVYIGSCGDIKTRRRIRSKIRMDPSPCLEKLIITAPFTFILRFLQIRLAQASSSPVRSLYASIYLSMVF